jgi:uncharacterized protein YjbI with pentapeptide repeats
MRWARLLAWGVGLAGGAVVLAVAAFVIYGYVAYGPRKPGWVGVADKTLWDWLNLLIVPFVLGVGGAVGGYLFTRAENRNAQTVEEQRAQDAALQAYLDQMGTLLLDHCLRKSEWDAEVRDFARAQTLTVLNRLENPDRKRSVLQLLYETTLISRADDDPVIVLSGANLSGSNLEGARLGNASLQAVNFRGANFKKAEMDYADLMEANLSKADLSGAILLNADLPDADLSGAIGITNEELARQAASLDRTTMPNGQKYEEWLKGKEGRGEDGENSGPS